MANGKRSSPSRRVRYFFLDIEGKQHLHKVLHITRAQDLVLAWDYTEAKRKQYVWSDVRKTMQNAFSISDTAQILNRHRMTIDSYIRDGLIRKPQMAYRLSDKRPTKYLLSERDVLDLHQAMSEIHIGRPRNDGLVTNGTMPTREEVKTLVRNGQLLYTRDDEGNFIPIWKEQVW